MHQRSTGSSQAAPIAPGQAVRHPRRCQRHRRTLAPPAAAAGATWSLQQRPDDHTRFSGSSVQRQLADTRYDAEIAAVALPALAGMLLEPTVGVINAAVVGQLGKELLGAVSVGSLAISFCTFLASFLMFLTTPEIAAAVGKDQDKVGGRWGRGGRGACGRGARLRLAQHTAFEQQQLVIRCHAAQLVCLLHGAPVDGLLGLAIPHATCSNHVPRATLSCTVCAHPPCIRHGEPSRCTIALLHTAAHAFCMHRRFAGSPPEACTWQAHLA